MLFKRLTWICAGLFVLFGLLGLLMETPDTRRFWAGLAAVSLGGFALSMVGDALKTGQIRLRYSVIRYAAQPWLYWAAVILVAAAGAVTLTGALWILFFKS